MAIACSQTNQPIDLVHVVKSSRGTTQYDRRKATNTAASRRQHQDGQTRAPSPSRHRRSERVPQNPTPPHKSYPQIDLLPACTACIMHPVRSESALRERKTRGRSISDIGPGQHATPLLARHANPRDPSIVGNTTPQPTGSDLVASGTEVPVLPVSVARMDPGIDGATGFQEKKRVMMKSRLLTSSFQVVSPAGRSVWG